MDKEVLKQGARQAVAALGGQVHAARILNLRNYQTVQSWLQNRVPAEYCPLIERESARLGRPIRCEQIRPDVEWSVLRTRAA